jgi:hypothetical protein
MNELRVHFTVMHFDTIEFRVEFPRPAFDSRQCVDVSRATDDEVRPHDEDKCLRVLQE